MSVVVKPYRRGFIVDIRVLLADGARFRERRRMQTDSIAAAKRWGLHRERELLINGPPKQKKEVPTLAQFAPRFLNEYARANRQKPSGISNKEIVLRIHLLPELGKKRLNKIGTRDVDRIKYLMREKSPKTVNNALTCLSKLLKVAVECEASHFLRRGRAAARRRTPSFNSATFSEANPRRMNGRGAPSSA